MNINKYVAALILSLGLFAAAPATAAGPTAIPLTEAIEQAEALNGKVTKASEADAAAIDAKQARPVEGTEMYLAVVGETTIILLVKDGVVVFSSNPIPTVFMNKVLGKTDA